MVEINLLQRVAELSLRDRVRRRAHSGRAQSRIPSPPVEVVQTSD